MDQSLNLMWFSQWRLPKWRKVGQRHWVDWSEHQNYTRSLATFILNCFYCLDKVYWLNRKQLSRSTVYKFDPSLFTGGTLIFNLILNFYLHRSFNPWSSRLRASASGGSTRANLTPGSQRLSTVSRDSSVMSSPTLWPLAKSSQTMGPRGRRTTQSLFTWWAPAM